MAELNDVLGAILRDIAQARVTSDLFARNVSLEYEKDEVLSGFPVPRVEITQASIDLKFAVNTVEDREVDPKNVIAARSASFSKELAGQIYSEMIATDPRGDELEAILRSKGIPLETQLALAIEQTVVNNPRELDAAMDGKPEGLARKLQGEAGGLVLADDDVKEVLTRGTRLRDLREGASVAASATVDVLRAAAERTRPPGGEIDVGALPLGEYAARVAERIYERAVLANPRREELVLAAREQNVDLERGLREAADRVLREDPEALKVALQEKPNELVERLETELTSTLLEAREVKDVFTRRTRVTDIRTRLATSVTPALATFARDLRDAIRATERQGPALDVAVTSDELAELPETKVSQITVVSEIRNYEWVSIGEEGLPARRLQPE